MAEPMERRIKGGPGWIIAGAILIVLSFLFGLSPGGAGQQAFATLLLFVGAACINVGFFVRLFGIIDQQIVELSKRLPGASE